MKPISPSLMGTKPVIPLIFSLSSPIMLSLAVQSLYNIIDSVYISRYSSSGLTALSLAFPVQTLITAVASGTGVGTNILISNALGKNDHEKASRLILHGYVLSLINWILFVIIGLLFLKPYFSIFSTSQEVNKLGIQYLSIILIGSISPFLENVAIKILQATGNTVSPMFYQVCAAIINLVLDPILIWGIGIFPSMGISGAAVATIFAQFVSALLSVLTVFFRQKHSAYYLKKFLRITELYKGDIYYRSAFGFGNGSCICLHIWIKWHTGRFFTRSCDFSRCILQTSDLFADSHLRNQSRDHSCVKLQLRS